MNSSFIGLIDCTSENKNGIAVKQPNTARSRNTSRSPAHERLTRARLRFDISVFLLPA